MPIRAFDLPHENVCRDPVTAAIVIGAGAAAMGGASVYNARQERKAAENASATQERIAAEQLKAVQDSDKNAAANANAQRKLALARKSNTILTSPLGTQVDKTQINAPTILGAPA